MKATIEIPEDLYRQVKAKSALEGRAVREVTEELFRLYVDPESEGPLGPVIETRPEGRFLDGKPLPTWFGIVQKYARQSKPNDMESIRQSIAAGIVKERNL